MPKVSTAIKTAASYLTPSNLVHATKCSGKVVSCAGKAVEYGGKSIKSLTTEGKKLLDSYVKYLNQKDPKNSKVNQEFKEGMESLLSLIGSSAEFAEHVGKDIAHMGDHVSHFGDSKNDPNRQKMIVGAA